MTGRKMVDDPSVWFSFSALLSDCLTSCENNDLVAVHCTHGLNRSGYLVCRYASALTVTPCALLNVVDLYTPQIPHRELPVFS